MPKRGRTSSGKPSKMEGSSTPAAVAAANTLDKTLADALNPEQQRQYTQLQADEKASSADTAATSS